MKNTAPSGLRSFKIAALVGALALAACWAFGADWNPTPVEWFNDLVRAKNRALIERDRAAVRADPQHALLVRYVPKEDDGTLRIQPGDDLIEIGFRADGVVVWRKVAK